MKTIFFLCLSLTVAARADSLVLGNAADKVLPVVKMEVWAFPLEEVRLLEGPFERAMELDGKYLLSLDTERLVRNFRVNAGLPAQGEALGGWEAPDCELRGHFVGHYMTACAQVYASTGDSRYKDKGQAVVRALKECQDKLGSGYLSAYPESFIDRVEERKQVWAPYYTLHKILAGLEDMYVYCQDGEALEMARKFGDWVVKRNGRLSDEQMQKMLQTEQGGMNESLANLYGMTGDKRYLEISLRFNHHRVIDPLEAGEDSLTGLHANTQIPKFIGLARQYELTGDTQLESGARNFWETVVEHRSYVIGGNSDGEMFTATNRLWQMGPNTTETCNTYNMLKLTRHLMCWQPEAKYGDYYERALCNHILASQNPETGMMCYYVPLRSGSRKNFNSADQDFWCCTGTGVENHGKYGDSIYFHNENQLYISQFIGSELDWKEKGIKVRQESRFPEEEQSQITITSQKPQELEIKIRHPGWAGKGYEIAVNGETVDVGQPGSYVTIKREWKEGDRIGIKMPFELREEGFAAKPERVAVMDGPLVLAAVVNMKKPFPGIVSEGGEWLGKLQPVANQREEFSGAIFRIAREEQPESLTLEPFYKVYRRNYEVYWDQYTAEQWQGKEKEYAAEQEKQRQIEARTVDSVHPGEEQNERDHNQRGENTTAYEINDRSVRVANTNGWFSWDLKVLPGQPQELEVTFGGGGRGAARMDVYVDGDKLATEDLTGRRGPREKTYSLTTGQLKEKSKITVKFQAPADARGGSVFSLRIMKPAEAATSTGT